MALPSREFVMHEVDREFALQHPEAPRRLNPNDPGQAHLVEAWNAMYTDFLNQTVDSHFFRFYPDAPRQLDPNDPAQAAYVEYWNDIRNGIEHGTSQWNWDSPPHTADEAAPAGTGQQPTGTGQQPTGTGQQPTGTGQQPTGGGAQPQDPGVHMDESEFKKYVEEALEGAHYIGHSAEVLGLMAEAAGAGEGSTLVWLGETLGPVGAIASTIIVLWATAHAFGTGRRLQEQQGFCYGVMWEASGHPNEQKGFIDWFDDSADELRDAFYEGVAAGREKATWPSVHNRIVLLEAYYQAHGDDLETARSRILNDLWQQVRESDLGRDYLTWPVPESMQAY